MDAPSIPLPHPWSVLVRWPPGYVCTVDAGPGAGKSTLAALLGPSLWLTCEQSAGQASELLARCRPGGLDGSIHVVAVDRGEGDRLVRQLSNLTSGIAVYDSITAGGNLDEQIAIMARILAWSRGGTDRRILVIVGQTSDGTAAGRNQLRHMADINATIQTPDDGMRSLTVVKNRGGPLSSSYFTITATGAGSPVFPYSYSVEGGSGNYRLVPFPTDGARWDGLLKLRFREQAQGGFASSARPMAGYPKGILEPGDVDARRAFATAHGLRWLE